MSKIKKSDDKIFNKQKNELEKTVSNTIQNDEKNSSNNNCQEIQIVVQKNTQLFETLQSGKRVMRAGCLLMIFLFLLFIGLTMISLIIKDRVPYKNVMANDYGVFEMRDEQSDRFYFLFNTAELWCNSGIEVHKGEKLIIKASGIYNTEISHMHDKDSPIYWIKADGRAADKGPNKERDILLSKEKILICDVADPGCLLATVINDKSLIDKWQSYNLNYDNFITKDSTIKVIGKGADYVVPNDGVLLFTVNDVVFTEKNISIIRALSRRETEKGIHVLEEKIKAIEDTIRYTQNGYNKSEEELLSERCLKLERMWYNDNLGSFLIVIERPRIQE